MTEYFVPTKVAETEYVEKRSRFIGHVWPVESEEEARAYIEATKKTHYDARHNCWCYRLKNGVERYSDDGEPQGTAGQPMLNVFQREKMQNVCCVITRYFGGVLLGAGGLVRAYSHSAKESLDAAGISVMGLWTEVLVPCPYPLFERVKLAIESNHGVIEETDYGVDITLTVFFPVAEVEGFTLQLTELSGGQLELMVGEQVFRGMEKSL